MIWAFLAVFALFGGGFLLTLHLSPFRENADLNEIEQWQNFKKASAGNVWSHRE